MESPVNVQVTLPGCRPKSRVELVVVSRRIDVLISPHPLAILLRASSMIGTSIPLGSLGLKVPTGARIERAEGRGALDHIVSLGYQPTSLTAYFIQSGRQLYTKCDSRTVDARVCIPHGVCG